MKFFFALIVLLVATVSLAAQANSTQPSFASVAMDGSKVDTAALRGKVVVINLWFINCPNCVEEIKLLNQLVDEYKGNRNVVFLGLAASKKVDLEKFLKKNPFKYQVIPDSTITILTKFGTRDKNGDINVPFPMHYVLNRDGKVVVKVQGIKGVDAVRKELRKQLP